MYLCKFVMTRLFCIFNSIVMLLLVGLSAVSCRSGAEIPYISDACYDSAQAIVADYTSAILPGDELNISVVSSEPENAAPLNLRGRQLVPRILSMDDLKMINTVVDEHGKMFYPIVGEIDVVGISTDSLSRLISGALRDSAVVMDAIVTVMRSNFRVSVMGEVAKPGSKYVVGDRLTILEALAMAGDLTMYGQRQNVMVVRQENRQQTIGFVDLTSASLFDSPYYYLSQNDVVYVEPNKRKKKRGNVNTAVPSYISMGVSVIRALSALFFKYNRGGYYNRESK